MWGRITVEEATRVAVDVHVLSRLECVVTGADLLPLPVPATAAGEWKEERAAIDGGLTGIGEDPVRRKDVDERKGCGASRSGRHAGPHTCDLWRSGSFSVSRRLGEEESWKQ